MRAVFLLKWGASAVTLGLLSSLYVGGDRATFSSVLLWSYVVVAATGFVGLIWHPALHLFLSLAYFAVDPSGFLEGSGSSNAFIGKGAVAADHAVPPASTAGAAGLLA